MRPESPSEYIAKHEDAIDREEVRRANENLAKPFGEFNLADAGEARIMQAPFTLDFTYDKVENRDIYTSSGYRIPNEDLRELTTLSLKKDEVGQPLELSAVVPEDYRVYFASGGTEKAWSSFMVPEERIIVLNREPNNPGALLHLLHEIGHANVLGKGEYDFSPEKHRLRSGDMADRADVLLEERNAWAFALRSIKPFLVQTPREDGFSIDKQDVLISIKGYALKSYQENNKKIAAARASMHMSVGDEEWMMGESDWLSNFSEKRLDAIEQPNNA